MSHQPKPSVFPANINKYQAGELAQSPDLLAVEEPLEIQLNFIANDEITERKVSVTMRTPGHDFELATGFLFSEGLIKSPKDIIRIRHCESIKKPEEQGNVVKVTLRPHVKVDLQRLERQFYTNSSCGVCGKTSIEAIQLTGCPNLPIDAPKITADILLGLPASLRNQQMVFEHTGGLHAAALFDNKGHLLAMREDVGRHNAMDKLIGSQLDNTEVFHSSIALLSGRLSFELVQKALTAEIPIVAAVGAPSSLAVQLAQNYGMTLVGFLRNERFNIYTHPTRVQV
ncbi:formate dehydrogenase accessory sulfurtransferase FdhD [uncultured Microscilla sp.]|uniref:formate dehydrogenase accessory sulfurtransferase FdhD n=1 Tax=uncultured Microscilla sp. TaxID=432653 RepID=UPI00260238F9|nr:formate dehydrogenase accessory sulfurtransferase FdhD [uncultured Microscilla sp.]